MPFIALISLHPPLAVSVHTEADANHFPGPGFGSIGCMKITARVWGDVARYYRSNQGKTAFATFSLAMAGLIVGKKSMIAAALGAFGAAVFPLSVIEVWRQGQRQDAAVEDLAELSSAVSVLADTRGPRDLHDFETDVILARAQDLTRLDQIEARLARLEAAQ